MLKRLYIRNFTLIDELDIAFEPGFSVITGETGAGKSIIIGAIGLILGHRADAKQVKSGRDRCIVEAVFSLEGYDKAALDEVYDTTGTDEDERDYDECIVRREINAGGKSRAFINDSPANLATLRLLAERLIDIHSQHQNLLLNKEDFQISVLDTIAHNATALTEYEELFLAYKETLRRYDTLVADSEQIRENADYMRFQQKELGDALITEGEQERLEEELRLLSHAEEIKTALYRADRLINGEDDGGAIDAVRQAQAALDDIAVVYPEAAALSERLDSCRIELKDICESIVAGADDIDFDPQRMLLATERLDRLYTLEKKYRVDDEAGLLQKQSEIDAQLRRIDSLGDEIEQLWRDVEAARTACLDSARRLSRSRQAAATVVEGELSRRLAPLGIPNVRFEIAFNTLEEPADSGIDGVVFRFSSSAAAPLMPIAQVASGGEISRVMLSLKAMTAHERSLPTIVFDEIDTGVSGRVAEKMAHIMREISADGRQVICITHLPQIAATGEHHYKVTKTDTAEGADSRMILLEEGERVTEIAAMLSGEDVTTAAIEHARNLLFAQQKDSKQ